MTWDLIGQERAIVVNHLQRAAIVDVDADDSRIEVPSHKADIVAVDRDDQVDALDDMIPML